MKIHHNYICPSCKIKLSSSLERFQHLKEKHKIYLLFHRNWNKYTNIYLKKYKVKKWN